MLLVMDSGIGGLSVADAIRRLRPAQPMTYLADPAGFPYGDLDDPTLTSRLVALLDRAAMQVRPAAVVIACNTASTVALAAIRDRLAPLPVVGCVPPIKPAAEASRSRRIGLLATPATVRRAYVQDLVDRFAGDCTVFSHGSAPLAALAEAVFRGEAPDRAAIAAEWAALLEAEGAAAIDAVALGCTHYGLLLPELRALAPQIEHWFDPAEPVARRALAVLDGCAAPPPEPGTANGTALLTGDLPDATRSGLRRHGFNRIEALPFPRA